MIEGFQNIGRPETDDVVEVLLKPKDDGVWVMQQARWCAHLGQWIRDWTKRPIIDEVIGWRPKMQCGCCARPSR